MMIQILWYCQVETIIDVQIGDDGAYSFKYESMPSLLARWEIIKKDKHGKHCHNQRK